MHQMERTWRALGLQPHEFGKFHMYVQANVGDRTLFIELGRPTFVLVGRRPEKLALRFAAGLYLAGEYLTVLASVMVDDENILMGRLRSVHGAVSTCFLPARST